MNVIFVVALVILVAGCQQPAQTSLPRYQLVASTNGNAWKIDTQSGTTWLCIPTETTIHIRSACQVSKELSEP